MSSGKTGLCKLIVPRGRGVVDATSFSRFSVCVCALSACSETAKAKCCSKYLNWKLYTKMFPVWSTAERKQQTRAGHVNNDKRRQWFPHYLRTAKSKRAVRSSAVLREVRDKENGRRMFAIETEREPRVV